MAVDWAQELEQHFSAKQYWAQALDRYFLAREVVLPDKQAERIAKNRLNTARWYWAKALDRYFHPKPSRKVVLPPEQIERLVAEHQAGKGVYVLAKAHGLDPDVVRRLLGIRR